jgi:hypothetical protein
MLGGFLAYALSFGALPSARADEFSTIPAGDQIYTYLTAVRQGPWGGDTTATHALTRYEVAIETAKAILKLDAGRGKPAFAVSRQTLRSLRALTDKLRPELTRLGVDVSATLSQIDELTSVPVTTTERPGTQSSALMSPALSNAGTQRAGGKIGGTLSMPLSQRLRVYSALSAVARDTEDPFNDAAAFLAHHEAQLARPEQLGAAVNGSSAVTLAPSKNQFNNLQAGAALGLTNWMQVHTNYTQNRILPGSKFENRAPLFAGASEAHSVGTGLDIAVRPGVKISGDVAHVAAVTDTGDALRTGTRFGGALNLSAWQNRLSLSANLSRLVPEDSQALPSTAAELNLGVGVTEHLQLSLLYQEMFSAQRSTRSDRVVSGGISVKF